MKLDGLTGGSWRGAIKAVTSLESMHQTPLMSVENWNETVLEELKLISYFVLDALVADLQDPC